MHFLGGVEPEGPHRADDGVLRGLAGSEVAALKVADSDSRRMVMGIERGIDTDRAKVTVEIDAACSTPWSTIVRRATAAPTRPRSATLCGGDAPYAGWPQALRSYRCAAAMLSFRSCCQSDFRSVSHLRTVLLTV